MIYLAVVAFADASPVKKRRGYPIHTLKRIQSHNIIMNAEKAYRKVREQAEMRSEVRKRISEKAPALSDLPDH